MNIPVINSVRYQRIDEDLILRAKLSGKTAQTAKEQILNKFKYLLIFIVKKHSQPNVVNSEYYNDVLQEARLSLLSAINSYDHSKGISFGTFAYTVIKNNVISYNKKLATHNVEFQLDESTQPQDSISTEFVIDNIPSLRKYLNQAILNLTQNERNVIELHFFQDMKDVDTAKTMGVTKSRISILLKAAKIKLKNELELNGYTYNVIF